MQLFQGSPTPVTLDGEECLPFKTSYGRGRGDGGGEREVWESGCVSDPTSPLYRRCAVELGTRSWPKRTGYCASPKEHMKVRKVRGVWASACHIAVWEGHCESKSSPPRTAFLEGSTF